MTQDFIFDIISPIISPELQKQVLPLKILFIFISLILCGLIYNILKKTDWLKHLYGQDLAEFGSFKALEAIGFVKKWTRVKARLGRGWESEAKLSIIEADQLLNDLLKRMGYVGKSLGERLKQLDKEKLPNIEQVWEAHKIRNNLVHDSNYKLSLAKAEQALDIYSQTFKHLEAL